MPLSIPVLDGIIQTDMLVPFPNALTNPSPNNRFTVYTNAIATGVVTALIGATFTTSNNTAVSSAVGILGLSASNLGTEIKNACLLAWGGGGTRLQDECNALATAIVNHLQSNALLSTPGGGTGTVSFITSSLSASTMATTIQTATGFTGTHWGSYCMALAGAVVAHIKAHGTATLTGSMYPNLGPGNGVVS